MFSAAALIALASSALPTALAHGGVLAYSWSGQWYQGWSPYNSATGQTGIERPWSSYNPIQDATDPTISCNNNGAAGALQLTGTVAAGTAITAYWNQIWPHPYGYMFTYLANCNGACSSVSSDTLQWFKIDQSGLLSGTAYNGTWGPGIMIEKNSTWTTTIPKSVPNGNYLIRFETIAMHSLPAQFYPECAQITITGGGTLAPTAAELVTFPGGYSSSDPALTLDIYGTAAQTMTSIPLPGPPLYAGVTSLPYPPAAPSSSSSSSSSSSTISVGPTSSHSSTSVAPTSSSTAGTAAEYGQCGGQGWAGPTACASPFVCTVSNTYYSQCLPA